MARGSLLFIVWPDLTMNETVARDSGQESTWTALASVGGPSTMRNGHGGWTWKALAAMSMMLAMVGAVVAQAQPRQNRGRVRNQGGAPLKKARPEAADPLAKAADVKDKAAATGSFHYIFKLHSFDGTPLAASFYPSKLGSSAPVVMLIHEANRSRKDFEEPVTELKGQGLAEHLQNEGYAVLQHGPPRPGPEPSPKPDGQRPAAFGR